MASRPRFAYCLLAGGIGSAIVCLALGRFEVSYNEDSGRTTVLLSSDLHLAGGKKNGRYLEVREKYRLLSMR
eukprot:3457385-Pyramimonas_sp.AAC.1